MLHGSIFICPQGVHQKHLYTVKKVLESNFIAIDSIYIVRNSPIAKSKVARSKQLVWNALMKIIGFNTQNVTKLHNFLSDYKEIVRSPNLIQKGQFSTLGESELKHFLEETPQFILSLGVPLLHDEVISSVRYGVWYYEHDLKYQHNRLPYYFYDFLTQRPVVDDRFLIYRNSSQPLVLARSAKLKNRLNSYRKNLEHLFHECSSWPEWTADFIQRKDLDSLLSIAFPSFSEPKGISIITILKIIFRQFIHSLRKFYISFFTITDWNIGIIPVPITEFIESQPDQPIYWFPKKNHILLADPFGTTNQQELTIYCEWLNRKGINSGRIASTTFNINSKEFTGLKTVIDEGHHISYPYIVRENNQLWCVPETHETDTLKLFAKEEGQWTKKETILTDFPAVDATLIKHHGKWWIFCTRAGKESNHNLYIWYSPDIHGPWKQHPQNPVKTDITSARPGGTPFFIQNELYRPVQDSSEVVGGAVRIYRVQTLNEEEFKEQLVKKLDGWKNSSYPDGFHTLSSLGSYTLIDGRKAKFSLRKFRF